MPTNNDEPVELAIFTVDSAGNITGSQTTKPKKKLIVNNWPGQTYNGNIYANHNEHNGTMQLVGHHAMTVGTTYTIHGSASEKNYQLTTTQPGTKSSDPASETARERPKREGTNGTLYVGSGG